MVWMVFAPKNRVLLHTTRKRPGTWAKQRPDKKAVTLGRRSCEISRRNNSLEAEP